LYAGGEAESVPLRPTGTHIPTFVAFAGHPMGTPVVASVYIPNTGAPTLCAALALDVEVAELGRVTVHEKPREIGDEAVTVMCSDSTSIRKGGEGNGRPVAVVTSSVVANAELVMAFFTVAYGDQLLLSPRPYAAGEHDADVVGAPVEGSIWLGPTIASPTRCLTGS
jgi:hypothetical protein